MKTMLLAATMLTAAVATPALAQTANGQRDFRSPYTVSNGYTNGYSSYGYRNPRAAANANNVYDPSGHYIGSDPDPSVRDQLARDPSQGD